MRRFGKLICMCLLSMSIVGCSNGSVESDKEVSKKIEYDTVTVSRPEGEKVDVQFPKDDYNIVKSEGSRGEMGYWNILKGDKIIGELGIIDSSVSDFKEMYSNIKFVEGSKDNKAYIIYELYEEDKKTYCYDQDICDGVEIFVSSDSEEDRKEIIDNFKFIEHIEK